MKKILLLFLFITTSMGTIRLSAYCFHNWSNEKIRIHIYSGKMAKYSGFDKTWYDLSPKGKGCWNWKEIDKKNPKKEWYWVAYTKSFKELGEGYFPIKSAVHLDGEVGTTVFKGFNIYVDGKPWKWRKPPWNHKSKPWKTYKRQ